MSFPERTYVEKRPTIQVIDPSHPQAEADAIAWDKGVVSLTETTLVYDDGGLGGEQTVDIPEGCWIVCVGDVVTPMPVEQIEQRWEFDPNA